MTMSQAHNQDSLNVAGARGDGATKSTGPRLHFGHGKRLPVILQTEASECGLACLAMICGYHGNHATLPALRRRFTLSLKGITATRLIEMAQSLGLQSRPVRLDMHELKQLQTPCILHWELDHFVVLREVRRKHVTIHDPAVGERHLRLDEVGKAFTGIAIELSKGPTFRRKKPEPPVSLRTLAGSIHGLGRALTQVFALALVLELFALLSPLFLQVIVDQVLTDGDFDLLTILGLSFALLMVLQTAVSALRTWTVMWLNTHFNLSWTGNVFQRLLRLPQAYFMKRHLGDIVSRFGAVQVIQQTITSKFVEVILDGVMSVLTLVVMLIYSPLLAGITVAGLLLYAGIRSLYFRVFYAANLSQITVRAKQQTEFMEAVRGVQTLRLYNQTPAQTARYLNATANTLNTSIAVQRLQLLFGSMNGLVSGAQRIGVIWLGAWLALDGSFSAGMLMAFVMYADQFTQRSASLIDYIINLKLLRMQGERLADIVLTPPEQHAEATYIGPRPKASIAFKNVSFRYAPGEQWILKDCSFEIAEGESVAITGPSGCGKTTLVRLLLGLLDPQSGSIEIGGIDLRRLGKKTYRAMTASVMQDDRLFSGSIADNISFFDESASMERIEKAACMADIHSDIKTMPMGYHTLVGDMGSALSGGQHQRIFIARALYSSPKILILDEATNHLDNESEHRVNKKIKAELLTRVVVAHKSDIVHSCETVYECMNGALAVKRHDAVRHSLTSDYNLEQH